MLLHGASSCPGPRRTEPRPGGDALPARLRTTWCNGCELEIMGPVYAAAASARCLSSHHPNGRARTGRAAPNMAEGGRGGGGRLRADLRVFKE